MTGLAFVCLLLIVACDDEDDDNPFGIRVNMNARVMVVGQSDNTIRVANEKVDFLAYRRTYNAALFEWDTDDRFETDLTTLTQPDSDAGYTSYYQFHHYLYWRAANHHDEIVMRAKLASQDDGAWVELKFTYEDAREIDDDDVTVYRTLTVHHPDY